MIEIELPGGRVCFSTRNGGVSDGPFESLNLGLLTQDHPERVAENRRRMVRMAGADADRVVTSRQVHGTEIREWHTPPAGDGFATQAPTRTCADGHATEARGLGLVVLAADCVPVALVSAARVAMVHCGWRGLADGIIEHATASFDGFTAVIGPGIGPCCYEVGEEVSRRFSEIDGALDGRMLDLKRVISAKLAAGRAERIEDVGLCTSCRGDLFFSHRRDRGVTGRQGGIVWRA